MNRETLPVQLPALKLYGCASAPLQKRLAAGFNAEVVKQNPKRTIYRLKMSDSSELYLKHFLPQNIVLSCFRFYAKKEYQAAIRLANCGLPVIPYLAWGRFERGGFCISEGLQGVLPVRQFFFETYIHSADAHPNFLLRLAELITLMKKNSISHPDFHIGNILYHPKDEAFTLPDPWGVSQVRTFGRREKKQLCFPWLELSGSLPETEIRTGIIASGLASSPDEAELLLTQTRADYEKRMYRHRKKLHRRILSGKSKFATTIRLPEGECSFRHTEWFTQPETMQLSSGWRSEKFPADADARKVWLDSFLQLPHPAEMPLAYLKKEDGSAELFYAD